MHPLLSLFRTLSLVSAYCSPKDLSTLSCHNTTALTSTCCSEYPGGLLLQTQYWLPSPGPAHSWTIHGLWPDFCNGTYPAYCDAAREYASPVAVLEGAGEHELLRYMRKYWKTNTRDGVDDEAFWKHEFDKHGTCMSTLEPRCYGKRYTEGIEEVQHFKATKKLFKRLDSFKWLKKCGIVPSDTKMYSRVEVVGCLQRAFGATPFVGCDGEGQLNELWYYHWLRGKVLGGQYEETESTRGSSCPENSIRYLPK